MVLQRGGSSARKLTRARILLHADEGATDDAIAVALHIHRATVESTRQKLLGGAPQGHQHTSFIVIKDDALLYEAYFNGHCRASIVTSFSMAKSFNSVLIGIAIDEVILEARTT